MESRSTAYPSSVATRSPSLPSRRLLSYPPAAVGPGRPRSCARTTSISSTAISLSRRGLARFLWHVRPDSPHVLTVIGGDLYDPSKRLSPHRVPPLRAVVRAIMRASDAVVAPSHNTIDNARRFYGFQGPIEKIPLGIVQSEVQAADRRELGLPDGFLAISVGRLIQRKALGVLLDALASPAVPDTQLVLIGTGPELRNLRARAQQLGVAQRVHFLGQVDQTRKLQMLRAADVYVSSSMHEGFGLVYLEAMAAGLPIVTTGNGGHTDYLIEGTNAFLVPVAESASLAEAIARLQRHPDVTRHMRAANLETARSFEASRFARAYSELFARVVADYRGAQP